MDERMPPGYSTQSEDTSYAAERLLFERWGAMDPAEKAALVDAASAELRALCRIGLTRRLPAASAREIELRALALEYGADLVRDLLGVEVPDEHVRIP